MKNATAVVRAVARDAEARAKTVLTDVLAAHTSLREAEAAITAAATAKAAAHPALARAIDTALAAGITTEQLTGLGIDVPSARTRRRASQAARAANQSGSGVARCPAVEGQHE